MTWKRVRLKEVGTWYGGGTPSKSEPSFWTGGDVPWLSPKDMGPEVLKSTIDHVTDAAVTGSSTKLVPAGSVAIVTRSGILERTMPVALVPFATTMNQDMKAVVPRADIDARWIAWGLRAYERELLRETRKAGTTVASIEMPRFYDFELPLPALDEQRRIVAIIEDHISRLDAAADYVAASRRRLIALERAALDSHFGGTEVALADLTRGISAGKSFGSANAPAKDGQWGIIKVSAMTWGEFDPSENKAVAGDRIDPRFEIREGDLLVSRANTAEYVGSSVLVGPVRPKLLLSDKSLRVTPKDDVSAEWLWRALQAPSARRQITALATGTKDSMRNISQSALKQVLLPRADVAMQADALTAFGAISDATATLRNGVGAAESRLAALRRSLLAAAFSGRLTGARETVTMSEELQHV
ncbi:type I restriction enzyme S subunit [Nocardioides sp. J9]|uniref:restriction endonuclease subunit S n=1 Tax=Nocardioides sp. J9 TaxID=935844 RepID=UPI0011A044A8|nr:restriction endonuclease subunit S [Nocardioides sp. J9]TWH03142.1 type I restriction enzyme S subunit [Nocardioides sp. J9]